MVHGYEERKFAVIIWILIIAHLVISEFNFVDQTVPDLGLFHHSGLHTVSIV